MYSVFRDFPWITLFMVVVLEKHTFEFDATRTFRNRLMTLYASTLLLRHCPKQFKFTEPVSDYLGGYGERDKMVMIRTYRSLLYIASSYECVFHACVHPIAPNSSTIYGMGSYYSPQLNAGIFWTYRPRRFTIQSSQNLLRPGYRIRWRVRGGITKIGLNRWVSFSRVCRVRDAILASFSLIRVIQGWVSHSTSAIRTKFCASSIPITSGR